MKYLILFAFGFIVGAILHHLDIHPTDWKFWVVLLSLAVIASSLI